MPRGVKHVPTAKTRETVKECLIAGFTHEETAAHLGITHETLNKHYAEEVATARKKTIKEIAGILVREAKKGNMTAVIFYLKTQGMWKEKQEIEAKIDGPIPVQVIIEKSNK